MSESKKSPPPPPGSERRVYPRFELLAQVELTRAGEVSVLPVRNLSRGGLAVDYEPGEFPEVPLGETITVFLNLGADHRGEALELRAKAEVVRVDLGDAEHGPSFGVQFVPEEGLDTALDRILGHLQEAID